MTLPILLNFLLVAGTFFVILTVLVMIHEFGHFSVARWIGVKVEEFGFGLPPRIKGIKIKDTIYSINLLPIGGFVKLAGEDEDSMTVGGGGGVRMPAATQKIAKGMNRSDYFWARSALERSAILVAGVFMNFTLAIVITAALLLNGVNEPSGRVHVESVTPGSPAAEVGIVAGDIIESIQDVTDLTQPQSIKVSQDLISQTKKLAGNPTKIIVSRNGNKLELVVTPRVNPPKGEGSLGVSISELELKKYSLAQAPVQSVKINLDRAWMMLTGIGSTLWGLITLKQLHPDVAGPIGIAQVTGQAVKFGFRAVLDFASILSLNLAILNILPIPALDGGRLAFVIVEKIIGRKIKPAFERQTHQIGMLILLILVVLVSINDVMRLAHGG
jgi:regulator of sigma E protease